MKAFVDFVTCLFLIGVCVIITTLASKGGGYVLASVVACEIIFMSMWLWWRLGKDNRMLGDFD